MEPIAAIHVGVFLLGLLLLVFGAVKKRLLLVIPGVLLFVPACWFGVYFFPFDWIAPRDRTAAELKARGYTFTFGQRPSSDFYETYLRVTRPDGKTAEQWVDHDGDKIWGAWTEQVGDTVFFRRFNYPREGKYAVWVDLGTSQAYSGLSGESHLDWLEYK